MICSFCNSKIEKDRGKMFVLRTGEIFYFCSSKCEKNWKKGRNPRKLKWVTKKKKVES
ncbi:MAG: 50S ribosomal protein L24e [archaeon]